MKHPKLPIPDLSRTVGRRKGVGSRIGANGDFYSTVSYPETIDFRPLWDGLLQFDGPGGGTGSASDLTGADLSHRYLWGPAVDQLLCDEQLSPLPPGEGQGEGSAG